MRKIQTFIVAFIVLIMGAFVLVPASSVGAAALDVACEGNSDSAVCADKDKSTDGFVGVIVNTLLFLVGALSVIMIIVGGILYATSAGDSSNITKAKNTILYSVIGLIVAFLAYAIINWVLQLF